MKEFQKAIENAYGTVYQRGYADGKCDAVVHGYWKSDCVCSACGFNRQQTRSNNYMIGFFCPYCGAQMDAKEDKDT